MVIATVAFDLGIDVRQVIHVEMTEDIKSYIQETGQAGRNALATLLKARTYHQCEKNIEDYYVANKRAACIDGDHESSRLKNNE